MRERAPNQVYYFDIGEGRWEGQLDFRITDFAGFRSSDLTPLNKLLAGVLHLAGKLPGRAVMKGEIRCDPGEGPLGTARVEVAVRRFGIEVFRLRGYYGLEEDGAGVDIVAWERFGPHRLSAALTARGSATIEDGGRRAIYEMPIFGKQWEGDYEVDEDLRTLRAKYDSGWAVAREVMHRQTALVPTDTIALGRWREMIDVACRVETLSREFDHRRDPRAPFTFAYAHILRDLAYRLNELPFRDPDWVLRLGRHFAWLFIDAVADWERQMPPQTTWDEVFDTIRDEPMSELDQFALCMLAHIAHDLPRALLAAGLTDASGESRIHDFHLVNRLLAEAIDPLQDHLSARYNPVLGLLDRLGGGADERLSSYALTLGRVAAWYNAERLLDERYRDDAAASIDRWVREAIVRYVGKTPPSRVALGLMRRGKALFGVPVPIPGKGDAASALTWVDRWTEPSGAAEEDEGLAALYALTTEIARREDRSFVGELRRRLRLDPSFFCLPKPGARDLSELLAPRELRPTLARLAARGSSARFAAVPLLERLFEGQELRQALESIGVTPAQRDAVLAARLALAGRAPEALAQLDDPLRAALDGLEAAGVPSSAALLGASELRASHDPVTRIFSAHVPAFFRVKTEEVTFLVEPHRWSEYIDQMVESRYLVQRPDGSGGLLREVVNVFHPWLRRHPLVLTNDLEVKIEDTPDRRVVRYALARGVCGSLDLDEGEISVARVGDEATLVVVEKRIRVKDNPLLYAMLRLNPEGLGCLMTYWIHQAAARARPAPGRQPLGG